MKIRLLCTFVALMAAFCTTSNAANVSNERVHYAFDPSALEKALDEEAKENCKKKKKSSKECKLA